MWTSRNDDKRANLVSHQVCRHRSKDDHLVPLLDEQDLRVSSKLMLCRDGIVAAQAQLIDD